MSLSPTRFEFEIYLKLLILTFSPMVKRTCDAVAFLSSKHCFCFSVDIMNKGIGERCPHHGCFGEIVHFHLCRPGEIHKAFSKNREFGFLHSFMALFQQLSKS